MNIQLAKTALIAATALSIVGVAAPVSAHHSFAMFDTAAQKTLVGTVKKFDWTNPHSFIWLDVANGGAADTWAIEGMSPNFLSRRGWSKNTIKPGDKITLTFHPLKNGDKGGSFMKVVLPGGQEMTMSGASPAAATANP